MSEKDTGSRPVTPPTGATRDFDLESYLSHGVADIVRQIVSTTRDDPRETRFALHFSAAAAKAEKVRARSERQGRHVPPFLICSVTDQCNLHCAGCYAWANHICEKGDGHGQLPVGRWDSIFSEAHDLGISFALLAGGEPCMRTEVLKAAGTHADMLFPVFTNGTLMDETRLDLFDAHRNLVPVLSIEGDEATTNGRRGAGVHARLMQAMAELSSRRLLFGASITVTSENIEQILSADLVGDLADRGVRALVYVEYVPFDTSPDLALDDAGRTRLARGVEQVRATDHGLLAISFPGDEAASGGCLAAGRGFCHINSHGGVEPCPFSPFSDTSLAEVTLAEALDSPLFRRLRERGLLAGEHAGGCTLFDREDEVRAALVEADV
jgi:MoaA/NifB/PqqE/SkfB family radical SAM enzyme